MAGINNNPAQVQQSATKKASNQAGVKANKTDSTSNLSAADQASLATANKEMGSIQNGLGSLADSLGLGSVAKVALSVMDANGLFA
jgi:hypothetical protein